MTSTQQGAEIFSDMRPVVDGLLVLLSDKERFVVVNRFNLDLKGRKTLDSIGRKFTVTRERVRQIEKNALTKLRRNVFNTPLTDLQKAIRVILESAGGLMTEAALFAALINDPKNESDGFDRNLTRLAVVLADDLRLMGNTIDYQPYLAFQHIPHKIVQDVSHSSMKILARKKTVLLVGTVFEEMKQTFASLNYYSQEFVNSVFDINKQIKVLPGAIGLLKWRHINPRTLRDKIYFILRGEQKPLHFVDIANGISQHSFDSKSVNSQAVHNELIRHEGFVLIGRGIYALEEWGYEHGTTKDVIIALLKRKKSMTESEIVKKVLEKRQVKPITVSLALKNSDEFVRIGRKKYSLK